MAIIGHPKTNFTIRFSPTLTLLSNNHISSMFKVYINEYQCTNISMHTQTHTRPSASSKSMQYIQPSSPSSDSVAMDDHVRFSGGSDSCSRMETSGAIRERGICWEATVTTWIWYNVHACLSLLMNQFWYLSEVVAGFVYF